MVTARRLVQFLFACSVALTPLAGSFVPVRAVVGGYVEVHELGCPPGYSPDALFRDCHDNRLAGVDLIADGPGGRHYSDATDQQGRVVFGDFLEAGPVTVAEAQMTGEYVDYVVFCSRVDNRQPVDVEKHSNGRAAFTVNLPQDIVDAGTGLLCDWYNLPEPLDNNHPSQGELPSGTVGLDLAGWIEVSGNPTGKDGLVSFDKRFIVGFTGDVATYIIDPMPSGTTMTSARRLAATLMPDDAALTQRFFPPEANDEPSLYVAEEYQSSSLKSALGNAGLKGDGSILVVYEFVVDLGTVAPMAERHVWIVRVYAGTSPQADAGT